MVGIEIPHWINIQMNIQPEIICAAGVPGLLPDLLALPVLPVMKYFIEGIWIQIFSLRSSLQEQWQWEWICLGRKLDAFLQLSSGT